MARAFNKITFQWYSTESDPNIVNDSNWIIDPIFDNESWANQIGPTFWAFPGGSSITTPTTDAYNALIHTRDQNAMWENIKNERDRRKLEGGYAVGANWFHSDTTSRIQQIGLVMLGANIPANLYWKTMSGSFVLMTQTLATQIFQAAAASDVAIFTVAEQKKAAMLASSDPASYNYLSGWPTAYGE